MSELPLPLMETLRFLVQQLQGKALIWAVTGSGSLALQGLPVEVHDLDLRTTAEGAYQIEAVFPAYQKRPVRFASTEQVRSHFGTLAIHGVPVEIIGDMQHRLADGSWEPIVDMNQFIVWTELDGLKIPAMSLPFLYNAYQLLGRRDKAALLQEWLAKQL